MHSGELTSCHSPKNMEGEFFPMWREPRLICKTQTLKAGLGMEIMISSPHSVHCVVFHHAKGWVHPICRLQAFGFVNVFNIAKKITSKRGWGVTVSVTRKSENAAEAEDGRLKSCWVTPKLSWIMVSSVGPSPLVTGQNSSRVTSCVISNFLLLLETTENALREEHTREIVKPANRTKPRPCENTGVLRI